MKRQPQQSVTSLPPSPDEERRGRMRKYTIAMGIRLVCFALCLFSQGWWQVVFVIGALVLPYIAVVLANTTSRVTTANVERPGALLPIHHPGRPGEHE